MNYKIRQLEENDFTDNSGFVATMANMKDISDLDLIQLKTFGKRPNNKTLIFL